MQIDDIKMIDALEVVSKGIDSINRLASGIERLVEEPMMEIESLPAMCPHCRVVNPVITIEPSEQIAVGPVVEFVLQAFCKNCKNPIFAIANSWSIFKDKRSALEGGKMIIERNYGNGN